MTTRKTLLLILLLITGFQYNCTNKKAAKLTQQMKTIYAHDTLKRQDAVFLTENIEQRKHYAGKRYERFIHTIANYSHADTLKIRLSGLREPKKRNLEEDKHALSAETLRSYINRLHQIRHKTKWKDSVTDYHYQQFVLPYKLSQARLENWRDSVLADYGDTAFRFTNIHDAAEYLIKKTTRIKKDFTVLFGNDAIYYPPLPYSSLKKIPFGSCREMSDYITYILRAHAIPCTEDFTPNYTNLWSGHDWNTVIDEKGKTIPFVIPLEVDTLGRFKADHYKLGKVYRRTFTKNPSSHAAIAGKQGHLPSFLNDEYIVDVTHEYIPTVNASVPLTSDMDDEHAMVYLSVFNNITWVPVAWGKYKAEHDQAVFKEIGTGSVYMPMQISSREKTFLNDPFILDQKGEVHLLKPDPDHLTTLTIKRKFPIIPRIRRYIERMRGGYFEVANNPQFKNSQIIHRVDRLNGEHFNEIRLNLNRSYRYIRFVGSVNSFCNVAELAFYNTEDDTLKGEIIATEGLHPLFPDRVKENAFDGNVLTVFHSKYADSSWIGMDFGEPVKIGKIQYLPRNANNIIVPGNEYEVFYWDKEWVSLGRQEAKSHELTYAQAPSNALYFIRCHTEGREERIFTYENGEQIWW